MLIDAHIHVGQFYQNYITPSLIHGLMEQMCVSYYVVSSTTQCEENYPKVIEEIEALIHLDGDKVLPVMWITPEGLKGNIAWYLESEIKWKAIKIHPFLNKTAWIPDKGMIKEVIDIARELHLPLLIHTGFDDCCKASLFEPLIGNNPDITFILAHGRPLTDAIRITKNYDNAFADSAFVSTTDMKAFLDAELSHKLLWGTDMFIPKHFYPSEDMAEYYQRKLHSFRDICTDEQFTRVSYKNAKALFNLSEEIE